MAFAVLFLSLAAPARLLAAQHIDWSSPVPAVCAKAVDGDSLMARVGNRKVEIRLVGIDAPEHGQEWGEASRRELLRLCGPGNKVRLERDLELRDRYGRYLMWVWSGDAGDMLLNETMVRSGLALPFVLPPNGLHRARIGAALEEARDAGAGFWSQGGLQQTPRQWRNRKRP